MNRSSLRRALTDFLDQRSTARAADMIPVQQTRTGMAGNCLAACFASILEVPITQVPDFSAGDKLGNQNLWIAQLQDWLMPQGLLYVQVPPDSIFLKVAFRFGETYHTIEGVSYRGGPHAVVGCNGKMVFDPHAGANPPGLKQVNVFGLLCQRSAIAGTPNSRRY